MNEAQLKKAGIIIRQRGWSGSIDGVSSDNAWISFQVVDHRKVVSRHDSYEEALKAATALVKAEV